MRVLKSVLWVVVWLSQLQSSAVGKRSMHVMTGKMRESVESLVDAMVLYEEQRWCATIKQFEDWVCKEVGMRLYEQRQDFGCCTSKSL